MSSPRVLSVAPASAAEQAGLSPGDEICAINGAAVRDVIQYQLQVDEPYVELEIRRGGIERTVAIEKAAGEPLGLELSSAVFDRVRTCDNHCPFCFIYQLPEGMRKSLSVKDDDYRLSFLYGNFTTLTRFTEADLERVVTENLSPLYVSIHATDPELRARLLRNRRGATSLRWLEVILDAGIEVHGQVVVCPGLNDGPALDATLLGVLDRFPSLATVGVVPLGISAHNREAELRPTDRAGAATVVDTVARWQDRYDRALGRRLVYAADEYYLLARRAFPTLAEYDGAPQLENGIGMAATFADEVHRAIAGESAEREATRGGFFQWVDGSPAEGYRAPRADASPISKRDAPVAIVTGRYGEAVLGPLLQTLAGIACADVRLVSIENRFFGGNIAVTGLLTGADVAAALDCEPPDQRYLLPDIVLSGDRFLDGVEPDALPRAVEIVPTNGTALVEAVRAA